MNNSFFGKTCVDVHKYTNVKIITDEEEIEKNNKETGIQKIQYLQ